MTINTEPTPQAAAVKFALALAGTVLILMMLAGLLMRASQGALIDLDPALFYQFMTLHGAGMVGTAGLLGACIMWYFLGRHVSLTPIAFWIFLGLFLLGVVLILVAVLIGGFAGGWTFLYPLPALSGGVWEPWSAVSFVLGYTFIGVGFLIFYLEAGRAMIKKYGSLTRALGWPLAFAGADAETAPPPTVIASAAITVFNTLGIVVGAAVLVITLINLLIPGFTIDALLAKNMIYFFDHVFINASIYMAVIAVYEIIPEYTGRPWKSSRVFALAWASILLLVMAVYPHHLLQDMVMPGWMLVMGQIVSYLSGIPLLAVTTFSLLYYLRGSGIRWDATSAMLVLGVAGWSIGVVPAIIDGMISVNKIMHNTLWVPGHFHTYLLLGTVPMALGFMSWLGKQHHPKANFSGMGSLSFWLFLTGGFGFVLMFLIGGASSIPRRWAVHIEDWHLQGQIATIFATLVVITTILFVVGYLIGVGRGGRSNSPVDRQAPGE